MKLQLTGNVNVYYVQTLCMVFFPGTHFNDTVTDKEEPSLKLDMTESAEGVTVKVTAGFHGQRVKKTAFRAKTDESIDKTRKVAVGDAVVGAFEELLSYKPAWGMLTGVRPSKVATELLNEGFSKTRVKKMLTTDYLVTPKKAALATEVALAEKKIIGVPDKQDCSVYISIPFCPSRCSYCSFVAYTTKKLLDMIPDYVERLLVDVRKTFALIRELGLHVQSIYIGGGTPTVLTAEQLKRLLSEINADYDLSTVREFTLEAGRPDTITAEKLNVAASLGVNRISVNPQTLSDSVLQEIGRKHTVADFLRAYETARASGIPCINTDLIAGLPTDDFDTFSDSFDKILELDPENVTVHTFCVKRAAEIRQQNRQVYSLRGGDAGKCVDYSQMQAIRHGFNPYYMYRQKNTVGNFENVGFAKEGFEGLYNIYMMEEVHSIFAVGAGAVSKMVDWQPQDGGKTRIERLFYPKYPYEYLGNEFADGLLAQARAFYAEIMNR